MHTSQIVKIETAVDAAIDKVWDCYTSPNHIKGWNYASDDWHCPQTENDLFVGGGFSYRMESIDGSVGFDFCGTFTDIIPNQVLNYTLDDYRKVWVSLSESGEKTVVTVKFETETSSPVELQQFGWQSILENFKKYVEKM